MSEITYISKEVSVEGTLDADDLKVVVAGSFSGNINASEVILEEGSRFDGEVDARVIVIEGELKGKVKSINGENCIVTTESGDDIHALKINVNNNGDGSLVSLRPERVAINSSENFENNFEAKVKELIYLGDHIRSRVEVCGNDQFIVKIPNSYKEANLKEGSTVKLSWKASDSRALDLN